MREQRKSIKGPIFLTIYISDPNFLSNNSALHHRGKNTFSSVASLKYAVDIALLQKK